ncbi:MAG TPA: glycosyltransferase family 4 protein [Kiritimatiellia bacterium]|nr:glycosyltransferase family 4 protein [Kiritimatiellia bacterium]
MELTSANVIIAGLSNDRVELELTRALALAGVNLHVIGPEGSLAATYCPRHQIPFTAQTYRSRIDREARDALLAILRDQNIHLIHALTNRALALSLSATRRIPHPPKILAYRGTMGHLSRFDPASWFSYLNPRVDAISCVSHAVRDYLKTFRLPDSRLHVIWKGHDPTWYTPAPRSVLNEFGIPPHATVAVFTGNVRKVKGVDDLLRAMTLLPPSLDLHLLIIGEIREKATLRAAQKTPRVHLAGFRPDAASLTGACDFIVMPSIEREGLPKAVLEAMALGRTAVVTRVGGMPELVLHRESGLVVDPRHPPQLARAIQDLAADPALRHAMGRAALARIQGPFHFRHTVEKTLAVYQRLISS